jgi:hypothetical protein
MFTNHFNCDHLYDDSNDVTTFSYKQLVTLLSSQPSLLIDETKAVTLLQHLPPSLNEQYNILSIGIKKQLYYFVTSYFTSTHGKENCNPLYYENAFQICFDHQLKNLSLYSPYLMCLIQNMNIEALNEYYIMIEENVPQFGHVQQKTPIIYYLFLLISKYSLYPELEQIIKHRLKDGLDLCNYVHCKIKCNNLQYYNTLNKQINIEHENSNLLYSSPIYGNNIFNFITDVNERSLYTSSIIKRVQIAWQKHIKKINEILNEIFFNYNLKLLYENETNIIVDTNIVNIIINYIFNEPTKNSKIQFNCQQCNISLPGELFRIPNFDINHMNQLSPIIPQIQDYHNLEQILDLNQHTEIQNQTNKRQKTK